MTKQQSNITEGFLIENDFSSESNSSEGFSIFANKSSSGNVVSFSITEALILKLLNISVRSDNKVEIDATITDFKSETLAISKFEYSLDGGSNYSSATHDISDDNNNLFTPFVATLDSYTAVWDATSDLSGFGTFNVVFKVTVTDGTRTNSKTIAASLSITESSDVKLVSSTSLQESITGQSGPSVDFAVRRGLEGPQIIIEWDLAPLGSVEEIKILRKKFSYPQNSEDGNLVFSETPLSSTYYVDENIKEKTVYYYKLYYKITGLSFFQSLPSLEGYAFSCATGYFKEKLFDLLPEFYKIQDKKTRTLLWEKINDSTLKENFHLDDDSSVDRGELERFLALFGMFLDEIKCLIDFMPTIWDVDHAPASFLKWIAGMVAVTFNRDIPIDRQRIEIKNAIQTYKIKGTKQAAKSHTQKITSLENEVHEGVNNVFTFNRENRGFIDLSDESEFYKMGMCGDPFAFFIDFSDNSIYSYEKVWICPEIKSSYQISKRIIDKLDRTIKNWIPADTSAVISFEKKNDKESLGVPDPIRDSYEDTISTRLIFTFNDETTTFNDENVVLESIN